MKIIVMTGGTSGFGAIAAQRITAAPDTRLLLGARGVAPAGTEALPLDLAVLGSVRSFAASVIDVLGDAWIDALVFNAGMLNRTSETRTVDGFEATFAVNHLAHYLLLRMLLGRLARGAVVILTTSGAHDPAEGAGLPTPRHAEVCMLAHPDRDPDVEDRPAVAGRRAYTASKLCNVLTVRALAALAQTRDRDIIGIAYCPGQTPGTGLVRGMPLHLRAAWRLFGGPLGAVVPQFNSRQAAGRALADLALGVVRPPGKEYYATLRRGVLTWREPSDLARRDDLASTLWRDSAGLVQVTTAPI
ncbi:SDR family NAD(P)-dependent oxidoreductase [Rhodococcus sp. NPDC058639]|uniref:SDR family NAD(P)-dependent oxidoreductase n=1 Tax=Rhodococcus sp. NPDC058639 TaxID=3346570 RepID=UPI0036669487